MERYMYTGFFKGIKINRSKSYKIFGIFSLFFLVFCLPFCLKPAEGAKAWLRDVQARKTQGSILIDASLDGAFSTDITEAVSSGAPTRFRFLIRIKKNRGLWFDKKLREFEIHHTVAYDVLKKEYLITRSYPDGREDNLTTEKWEEMVKWMSELKSVHLPLFEIKDEEADYYIKLRAEMKCIKIPFPLNYLLAFVALWNFDTPWVKVPLHIDSTAPDIKERLLIDE